MTQESLAQLIEVAAGRQPADLVIKNCQLVDVGLGKIYPSAIAISQGLIAGIGLDYEGKESLDAQGLFALPGLIDAHIHIESSYLSPEEFARLVVPRGTTSVIADPHEIVNVAGLEGLRYMQEAAAQTPLKIEYMVPSCVPATGFENAGADLKASDLEAPLADPQNLGLAELMNAPGVVYTDPEVLAKVLMAKKYDKPIDGHSPGLQGKDLSAYAAAGVMTDHECSSLEEMQDRLARGMYVLLRQGSSCHDLARLLPGVTPYNASRCLLCSDDRHASTMLEIGHLNEHLQMCVAHGLHPITAVQMASLNTAQAYNLRDRGGLFPGRAADLVLVRDLQDFEAQYVYINGQLVAQEGVYLPPIQKADASAVRASFHVRDFSADRLKFQVQSHCSAENQAQAGRVSQVTYASPVSTSACAGQAECGPKARQLRVIQVLPGGVVTGSGQACLDVTPEGDVILPPDQDIVRLAVVERHHNTGHVGLGLLGNYGLRCGAIASSIAHDSHNIVVAGRDIHDMALAVEELQKQEGGAITVKDGQVLDRLPLPLGGLMSDQAGEEVARALAQLNARAHSDLGVNPAIDPVMTLSFMSLLVIPELKLSDLGLFNVKEFSLVPIELE